MAKLSQSCHSAAGSGCAFLTSHIFPLLHFQKLLVRSSRAWHLLNWRFKLQNAVTARAYVYIRTRIAYSVQRHTRKLLQMYQFWPCRDLARTSSGNVKNEPTKARRKGRQQSTLTQDEYIAYTSASSNLAYVYLQLLAYKSHKLHLLVRSDEAFCRG